MVKNIIYILEKPKEFNFLLKYYKNYKNNELFVELNKLNKYHVIFSEEYNSTSIYVNLDNEHIPALIYGKNKTNIELLVNYKQIKSYKVTYIKDLILKEKIKSIRDAINT